MNFYKVLASSKRGGGTTSASEYPVVNLRFSSLASLRTGDLFRFSVEDVPKPQVFVMGETEKNKYGTTAISFSSQETGKSFNVYLYTNGTQAYHPEIITFLDPPPPAQCEVSFFGTTLTQELFQSSVAGVLDLPLSPKTTPLFVSEINRFMGDVSRSNLAAIQKEGKDYQCFLDSSGGNITIEKPTKNPTGMLPHLKQKLVSSPAHNTLSMCTVNCSKNGAMSYKNTFYFQSVKIVGTPYLMVLAFNDSIDRGRKSSTVFFSCVPALVYNGIKASY
jgi:hypothetical protein